MVELTDLNGFEPVNNWAKIPHPLKFIEATSVAVDSVNNVYVFNRGINPIMIFNKDGDFIDTWGEGKFTRPHSIFIDDEDFLYLVDDGGHCVYKMTSNGDLIFTLGIPGNPSPWQEGGMFNRPTDLAIDSDKVGNLLGKLEELRTGNLNLSKVPSSCGSALDEHFQEQSVQETNASLEKARRLSQHVYSPIPPVGYFGCPCHSALGFRQSRFLSQKEFEGACFFLDPKRLTPSDACLDPRPKCPSRPQIPCPLFLESGREEHQSVRSSSFCNSLHFEKVSNVSTQYFH